MMKYIIEALALGISMGGYCAVSCAPFVVPYLMADAKNGFASRLNAFAQFLAGRLIAYILFAVLASALSLYSESIFSPRVNNILLITASGMMIVFSLTHTRIRFCQFGMLGKAAKGFPVVTGFILGMNMCPPFLVAFVNVLSMKNMIDACVYFFFLFLGTTVYLLPVAFISASFKSDFFRRMGIYLGIIAGAWFLMQGIAGLFMY